MYVGVHVKMGYTYEEVLESPIHSPPSPPNSVSIRFLFKILGKILNSLIVINVARISSALTEK